MYKDFEEQLNKIISNTEEKTNVTMAQIGAYKMMMSCIAAYVSKEAETNEAFNEALSYSHKSAARMIKFLYAHAKDLAVENVACVPDDMVYDWVNQYYFADDKAEIKEELRKAAEAKAKEEERKKKEKELEERAKSKALEKLEASEGWSELPDEEKKKKITEETRKIKSSLQAAERRKENAKKPKQKKTSAKVEFDPEVAADIAEAIGSTVEDVMSGKAFEDKAKTQETNTAEADEDEDIESEEETEETEDNIVEFPQRESPMKLSDIDGQLSLFDFM